MKKHFYLSAVFLCLTINFQSVHGQSAEEARKAHDQETQRQIQKSNEALIQEVNRQTKQNSPAQALAALARKKENAERLRTQRESLQRLNEQRASHSKDLEKFKSFLQQKNTGLFRLFPNFDCESKYIIKVDGDCGKTVADSYSYSFQKHLFMDGVFHDIRLHEDYLRLDGFLSQAIITDLGDVPLENVSLQSNYATFLVDFKPSSKNAEAKEQFWQLSKKININGYNYGKMVKPTLNTTYLARIINYRLDDDYLIKFLVRELETKEQIPFQWITFDKKRFDTIVAFRVIRIDEENSVSILWKQLSEKKLPKLKFAKGEKWTDLKFR